jgi:outer membrane protein OmpA-like peptidoglycan-associated protein
MKKYITLALAIGAWMFNSNTITAQNAQNPWAIGIGANIVSIDDSNSGSGTGVPALSLTRYLGGNLSIGAQFSANSIDGSAEDYYTIDGIVKYNIVKEGKVIPYLFAGYGLSRFNKNANSEGMFPSKESARTTVGGAGINVRLSDKWAANLSTSMRNASEKGTTNQLQHVIGLTYVFGTGDADGDGVSDKKDICPDVPGLKEFNGCPDTDGDGIPDNEDACPEEAGTAEMNGCPDTDGDGIADGDDACPEAAGSAEMGGCPDSDGDTVADKDDKCPNVAGEAGNNGCPWPDTDGDGVLDKDDLCPNVAGVAANGGCEAEPTKLIEFISSSESKIYFGSSSVDVGKSGEELVNNLKSLLDEYPDVNIIIQGHASDDGSESYNMKISQKRADTVAAALVAAGIDASRMTTEAYGESKPLSDRKSSRRVEFDRGVN